MLFWLHNYSAIFLMKREVKDNSSEFFLFIFIYSTLAAKLEALKKEKNVHAKDYYKSRFFKYYKSIRHI